jgi:uncharacterized membrane protein YdbT with pleckstrin-like domain
VHEQAAVAPVAADAEVLRLRPHASRLALPLLVLLVTLAVLGFAAARLAADAAAVRAAAVAALGAVLLRWAVLPWARWLATVLVVTRSRVSYRTGVLRRHAQEVPLSRVAGVGVVRSLPQRLLGSGTLVLDVAGAGRLVVPDVPQVRAVAHRVADMLETVPLDDAGPAGRGDGPGRAGRRW